MVSHAPARARWRRRARRPPAGDASWVARCRKVAAVTIGRFNRADRFSPTLLSPRPCTRVHREASSGQELKAKEARHRGPRHKAGVTMKFRIGWGVLPPGDPRDFLRDHVLDKARQIGVEPFAEHRRSISRTIASSVSLPCTSGFTIMRDSVSSEPRLASAALCDRIGSAGGATGAGLLGFLGGGAIEAGTTGERGAGVWIGGFLGSHGCLFLFILGDMLPDFAEFQDFVMSERTRLDPGCNRPRRGATSTTCRRALALFGDDAFDRREDVLHRRFSADIPHRTNPVTEDRSSAALT
jgi:hypothetical protein